MKWDGSPGGVRQSIARCIFQLSRRDREFLPFSLMLRDETENFCLSVSCFDEIEIFCLSVSCFKARARFFPSVSCFETRTRIFWLHEQMSSIDINCHNLKHKIVFFCFYFCKNLTFNGSGESESGLPGKPFKSVHKDT